MNKRPSQRGYVVFVLALSMIVICGFTGLVVDAGFGEYMKIQAQAAADAGAKAGALEIAAGRNSSIKSAALQDTANNGFTNGTKNVTVTVNNPPTSGAHTSDSSYVEVIVTRSIATTFMAVLGSKSMGVTARSVAGSGATTSCVFVMAPSGKGALTVSGGGFLTSACGVLVNSTSSNAMNLSGNGCVSAPSINIAGTYSNGSCNLNPAPNTGASTSSDPLASVPAPSVGGCNYANTQLTSGGTLNPGVYCNGISISGQSPVNLNPGTYILLGGGLSMSGQATLVGTGVTFYNTYNSTYAYGAISMTGGSASTLSAPASGPLAGILFFEDRSVTSSADNTFTGGLDTVLNGALYFLNSPLKYAGGSSAGTYTIIVANTLTITGNGYLNNDYSSLASGTPAKTGAVLAE